jgi:hypothetical protein
MNTSLLLNLKLNSSRVLCIAGKLHRQGTMWKKTWKQKSLSTSNMVLEATGIPELVIGHGIGGKVSQLKWRDSLKASCWSKQRRSVLVTRSHSQSTSDGSEDPLTLTPRIIGYSLRRISTTSPIEVSYELLKISWRR